MRGRGCCFFSLTVREYPDTDPPIVSVRTTYTGAAASVVETRVTEVIEESLSGIPGVETITSTSRDGQSSINMEFSAGADIESAANDVRDRVGAVVEDLPDDIIAPEIRKVDADASPIMFIFFSKPDWTGLQVSDYLDRVVVDRFSAIERRRAGQYGGEQKPSMRVWLDPQKLTAFGLTPADVEAALRSQNVELPAGRFEAKDQNSTLRVDRAFVTPADFARLVISRGADGYQVTTG